MADENKETTDQPELPAENISEAELVSRAKQGDQAAFEMLLRKYEVMIYNLAYRMLHNRADADDILQEAALKAYQALPSFKSRSGFGTWFYRIAANLCLMKLRRGKRAPFSLEAMINRQKDQEEKEFEIEDASHNPATHFARVELRKVLEDGIASLPSTYRAPFVLYEIDNLSVREISRILKISEPAVKTRLHRSRLLLREKLADHLGHLKK